MWKLKGKMDLALLIPKGSIRVKLRSKVHNLSLLLSERRNLFANLYERCLYSFNFIHV
jgi:hypothetical protein